MAPYPAEPSSLIEALLAGIREALGDNLLGAYLTGSLALGGFDRETSDVDVLVVTDAPISEPELTALAIVHSRLPPVDNEFRREYEVYYLDRQTARRFAPGQRQIKVGPDDPLGWTEHRPCGVLERWTVRERQVILLGPGPETLIDPVSSEDTREAAAAELLVRLQHWTDGTWPLSELAHRGAQGFEVETACRALRTIETSLPCSKSDAIEWALARLPARWRPLIEWSQRVRKDSTRDESRIEEVLDLVRWAARKSQT